MLELNDSLKSTGTGNGGGFGLPPSVTTAMAADIAKITSIFILWPSGVPHIIFMEEYGCRGCGENGRRWGEEAPVLLLLDCLHPVCKTHLQVDQHNAGSYICGECGYVGEGISLSLSRLSCTLTLLRIATQGPITARTSCAYVQT